MVCYESLRTHLAITGRNVYTTSKILILLGTFIQFNRYSNNGQFCVLRVHAHTYCSLQSYGPYRKQTYSVTWQWDEACRGAESCWKGNPPIRDRMSEIPTRFSPFSACHPPRCFSCRNPTWKDGRFPPFSLSGRVGNAALILTSLSPLLTSVSLIIPMMTWAL